MDARLYRDIEQLELFTRVLGLATFFFYSIWWIKHSLKSLLLRVNVTWIQTRLLALCHDNQSAWKFTDVIARSAEHERSKKVGQIIVSSHALDKLHCAIVSRMGLHTW